MNGLAESFREGLQDRRNPNVIGTSFMVNEREAQELVTKDVVTVGVLRSEPSTLQGDESSMNCRLGTSDRTRQLIKRDPTRMGGELFEEGEHSVGANESRWFVVGGTRRVVCGS